MKLKHYESVNTPLSYLIFSTDEGWYLNVNDQQQFGPVETYAEIEKYALVIEGLETELKNVA